MTADSTAGVVLFTKSLATMTAFYAGVLELPVPIAHDGIAELSCRGMRLLLHQIPPHIAETFEITTPPTRREEAAMKLSLPVASLSRARELAASHGGMIDDDDRAWEFEGHRYCDGYDPEGNVVQFYEVVAER